MKWIQDYRQGTNTNRKYRKLYFSSKYYFLIFFILIKIVSNSPFISKNIKYYGYSHSYEITIKVNGAGTQKILDRDGIYCPNSVTIDGNSINIDENNCTFINIDDTLIDKPIKISWNAGFTSLHGLFNNLTNLIEVDLSNYDTSSVISMNSMFYECRSITSINLEKLNTSSLENIGLMFNCCSSLLKLNLSFFNTRKSN